MSSGVGERYYRLMNNELTEKQTDDLKVLVAFVAIYCREKHSREAQQELSLPEGLAGRFRKPVTLCSECAELVHHGILKRQTCPLDPKPSCKKCHIHCYSREYRAKIREIMAFSGKKQILRGRIDYLWHYFF